MKKITKVLMILFMAIILCGCTKQLKDSEGKVIKNDVTKQTVTLNIVCQPTDEKLQKIYEENEFDWKALPKCQDMKVIEKGEGIWSNIFVRPLAWLIIKLGNLIGSTGWAIIIITFAIRMILAPFTKKTAMQSENIKLAQPELNVIEAKYKDKTDSESMNKKGQEMMMVYKKYNISPLSGCLFAFIQLPILFAFLEAINRVPAIFEETFLKLFQMGTSPWAAFNNSGSNWYYAILIVLILVTTYFSFAMNKSTASPEMAKQNKITMYFMVVFIGFMSFQLPAAIAIYWICSSGFTIIQNIVTDKLKKKKSGKDLNTKVKVKVKNGKKSI